MKPVIFFFQVYFLTNAYTRLLCYGVGNKHQALREGQKEIRQELYRQNEQFNVREMSA